MSDGTRTDGLARLLRPGSFTGRLLLVALASVVGAGLLSTTGIIRQWEWSLLDYRHRLTPDPHGADGSIVLVVLNGDSMDRLSWLSWPWPRQIYADCVDLLDRWGARAVVFDILFDLPSIYGGADDAILGDAAARTTSLFAVEAHSRVHGGRRDTIPDRAILPGARILGSPDTVLSCNPPTDDILAGASLLGSTSQAPDDDGVFRRIRVARASPEGVVPSLPLAAAWTLSGGGGVTVTPHRLELAGRTLPLDGSYGMILDYHGPRETYTHVPIADLLSSLERMGAGDPPLVDSTLFRGATVLFGYTAPGLMDLKPTPYSSVYPGVEVLATALDNMLSGSAVRRLPPLAGVAAAAVLALLVAVAFRTVGSVYLAALAALAPLVMYLVAAVLVFDAGIWMEMAFPLSAGILALSGGGVVSYSQATSQKRYIRKAFSQYLSPEVVSQVISSPERLSLGGEKRVMTALFSDIRGFTSISEGLDPADLVGLLNVYLTRMADIIMETGGTVDKFEGDAVIAFWGAPLHVPDHASRACGAALDCREMHGDLNDRLSAEGYPEIVTRIGLNSGPMVVGNMGSEKRFDYTMMGESVNLAARLEGVNKVYGTLTMCSAETAGAAGEGFVFRELDTVRVVGQKRPVTVMELVCRQGCLDPADERILQEYARALEVYRSGDLERAGRMFGRIPEDPPSAAMARRCSKVIRGDLAPPENGVFVLSSK
jgi:adenylate cyclase